MNVFARFQVVENLGSGLHPVSSDTEPAAIVTRPFLDMCHYIYRSSALDVICTQKFKDP